MKTTEPTTPEQEMLQKIQEQIERAKRNQKSFAKAIDKFFTESDKIIDNE